MLDQQEEGEAELDEDDGSQQNSRGGSTSPRRSLEGHRPVSTSNNLEKLDVNSDIVGDEIDDPRRNYKGWHSVPPTDVVKLNCHLTTIWCAI